MTVAVASCYASAPAWAVGGADLTAVVGSYTSSQSGSVLTLTTSTDRTIAEARERFNILANEQLRVLQPSSSSLFLLRVLPGQSGVLERSVIDGSIYSNGQFWLQNAAGALIGKGAVIDTAGFLATNMAVRLEDFMAGRLTSLQNIGGTGGIVNQGEIKTSSGGSVYLIGDKVTNEGVITTPGGETILAAGQTVNLIDTGTPGVKVEITGAAGDVTNLGEIVATAGRIGMAGVIVRNSGTLNASSVVSEGGRVFLKASKDAYVDGAGRIVATGTKGGKVEVLGERVAVMDQVQIDVSGTNGGGTVLVGGDYQGKNPDVQNATVTYFGKDASIKADATDNGDGGKVIVWADDTTRAFGSISARGGASSGDGGFVETSGHRFLDVNGARVDTRAQFGKVGSWLLDPDSISITNADSGGSWSDTNANTFDDLFSSNGADATLNWSTVSSNLDNGSVILQTGQGGTGNITFVAGTYSNTSANTLTLLAYGGTGATGAISLPAGTTLSLTNGNLTMIAGWDGAGTTSADVVAAAGRDITITQSNITAKSINLFAGNDITLNGSGGDTIVESTGSGTQNVTAGGIVGLTAGSGKALLKAGSGNQTVSAAKVQLQGGTAAGAFASIGANGGAQTVTASSNGVDAIKITAGTGSGTFADIYQYGGGSGATQTVTATNGGILLYGGASFAQIRSDSTQALQTITAGTILELRGATNYSNASAMIHSAYGQNISAQWINLYGGGSTAPSGAYVHDSSAEISAYGSQTITAGVGGAGGIYLKAGGYGGSTSGGGAYDNLMSDGGYNNQAKIRHGQYGGSGASGNQTINIQNASTVNVIGGTGDGYGGYTSSDCTSNCYKSSNEAGIDNHYGTQTLEFQAAGGTIALTGGTNGMGNSARIESDGQQIIRGSVTANAPTITLVGGASGGGVGNRTVTTSNANPYEYKFNSAEISSDTSQTIYGSTISLTGGTATYGGAIIGGGTGTSYLYSSGNVTLTGGTGAGSGSSGVLGSVAAIGNDKAYTGEINIDGSLSMVGGANYGNRALIGSLYGTANVTVNAYGGMTIGGGATSANAPALIGSNNNSGGSVTLYGGYSATKGYATAAGSGAVTLNAGSQISGITNAYIYSYAGQINQPASAISWISASALTARASGATMDVFLNGDNKTSAVTLSADDFVQYNAVGPIDANVSGKAITLTSSGGASSSSGYAINANVGLIAGGTSITATVANTATYGGINIRNTSNVAPGTVTLTDHSTYAGSGRIVYSSAYDIDMSAATFGLSSDYGSVTISSDGFLTLGSPGEFGPGILANATYGYVKAWGQTGVATSANLGFATAIDLYIGSGSSMTIGHNISNVRNIGLYSAGGLNLSGSSISASANAYLGGAGASLVGISVPSTTYGGGAVTLTGASVSAGGTLYAYSGSDMRLNDGSSFYGGLGVNLGLGGTTSNLYLNDASSYASPSYVMTGAAQTIKVAFPGRSADGIVIDGATTMTSAANGSGFFVGNHSTPAVKGSTLQVAYGTVASAAVTTVVNEVVSTINTTTSSTTPTSTTDIPPPNVVIGTTGGTSLTSLGNQTVGGGTGEFGGTSTSSTSSTGTTTSTTSTTSGGTASGDSGSGSSTTTTSSSGTSGEATPSSSASGDQSNGSKDTKEDKKDDKKDDKSKKADSGEKKDDKTKQKPVGKCSA